MKYINNGGTVIEALQSDGTSNAENDMRLKFNIPDSWVIDVGDYAFRPDEFSHGILKTADIFEKHFKPITDACVLIVEGLSKDMLLKLRECQKDGKKDTWRELGLSVLFRRLSEKVDELAMEMQKIDLRDTDASFDAARKECADVGNYTAMIHDLLNVMEFEAMRKNKEKL